VPIVLTPQSDLVRPSVFADTWGRYYTSSLVSEHLINAISAREPHVILELGAGRGGLMAAASDRWQQAKLVTVDMDHGVTHHLQGLARRPLTVHQHYVHDALDLDLPNYLGLAVGSVDLAVCNPPYVRPRWRARFGNILEEAGLSGALKSVHDAGADLLFVAQNLRLLRPGGKLGLILPDGLVTAEKFAGVRRALLTQHKVEQVVQLPRHVFAGTEAQTYLVVLAKRGGETESVALRRLAAGGKVSGPVFISAEQARRRLDYDFHCTSEGMICNSISVDATRVRDLVRQIQRGSISSHEISRSEMPVFHLTDFGFPGELVPRHFGLSSRALSSIPKRIRIALPGDLLVARIGRNLQDKVAVVAHFPCVVSDCVFILRVNSKYHKRVLAFLISPLGRQSLASSAHGVGARYLSTTDVLELQVRP
jgi:type I restriction enzyme M protein